MQSILKLALIASLVFCFWRTEARAQAAPYFPESFDNTTLGAYTNGNVILPTGSWTFTDALLGAQIEDKKNGVRSARIRSLGSLKMNFDVTGGVANVQFKYASYGTDVASTLELWASNNSGSTWYKVGSTLTTAATLQTALITVNYPGAIRFEIRKTSNNSQTVRVNIDDILVMFGATDNIPGQDYHLTLGLPSNATPDPNNCQNYLMYKPQYALSYNCSTGTANWVSWHLSQAWQGTVPRQDDFRADPDLPVNFYKVTENDYISSGFDRGHMCPSSDRDRTVADNSATFVMSNMVPQAPNNNQGIWADLEIFCRQLATKGNEMYIISGPQGVGGAGTKGFKTTTLNGKVRVPNSVWKIIVVLPVGDNDLQRITTATRVIAVKIPNTQSLNTTWGSYRVSVRSIEQLTGLNFLSNLPQNIQDALETTVDAGPTSAY